jgi:hypothetical protein
MTIGSNSNNRDLDTWRRLHSIDRLRGLSRIVDGKTVVVACAFISQTGFVQNVVDPYHGTLWE